MLKFELSREQYNELSALAYWVADVNYMQEKFGPDEPELQTCRDTIEKSIFPNLDYLKVPFWVQNIVSCWAENWRNYTSNYLINYLKTKSITLKEV